MYELVRNYSLKNTSTENSSISQPQDQPVRQSKPRSIWINNLPLVILKKFPILFHLSKE